MPQREGGISGRRKEKACYYSLLDCLKRYPCLFRDIQQIIHDGFEQWNPLFASDRFRFALGVARDERAVGAGSGFGVAEDSNPFVDLFFEFVLLDKAVDFHGVEAAS